MAGRETIYDFVNNTVETSDGDGTNRSIMYDFTNDIAAPKKEAPKDAEVTKTPEVIDKAKSQQRGEKTLDAMDRGEKIARLEELKKRLSDLEAKQAEIEKRLAALEGKKDDHTPAAETPTPEPTPEPTPASTPESNPTPENTPPQNDTPAPIIAAAPKTGEYPSPTIEKVDQQSSANILPKTGEYPSPAIERETKKKAKKNNGIKRFFASVAAISLAGILSFGFAKQKEAGASRPQTATEQDAGTATPSEIEKVVDVAASSETEKEKSYDYGWWQKRQKEIYFGQDCLDCYDNPELTKERILEATNGGMPEILAAYVKTEDGGFTKKEQEELGIYNMSYEELDDYLSNTNDLDAAVIKRKIADMIADKVNGKNTIIDYESVNEPQKSFYLNKNSDGDPTPENMKLYLDDYVERHGSKQALIYEVDENGNKNLLWRLNLKCGLQPTTTIKRSYKKKTQTPPQTVITPVQTPEATPIITPTEIKEDVPPVTIQTPFEFGPTGGPITTPNYVVPDTFTPTPAPGGGSSSETPRVEHVEPKNSENMTRIDNQIFEDIASDIHTGNVTVEKVANVEAVEERTSRPSSESYEGTEANIVQNESSREAESVSQASESSNTSNSSESSVNTISSENDYSEDRGGANAGNAESNPVEADTEAQEAADRGEIEQASGSEVSDILSELGIN